MSLEPVFPPAVDAPAVLPVERAAAALEVFLCSGFPTQLIVIAVLSTFGLKPLTAHGRYSVPFVCTLTLVDTALLLGLIAFFLRAHHESIRDTLLGWRRPLREALVGLALIPVAFFVIIAVLMVVLAFVPSLRNVPHNPLQEMLKTRSQAVMFAFVVMVAGGLREEVQRGFVLRRFEQYLGGGPAGLAIFSIVFGLGHIEQGYDVALATAVLGAVWGAIYLRRRSVVAPMVSHAGFNLLQVVKFLVAK